MLAHSNKLQSVEALRPIMTQAGFERRESTWYRFSPETIQVLDLQAAASPSSQRIYFNIGATLRELRPATHLRIFDCPLYGRLDRIIPPGEPFSSVTDFGDMTFSSERLPRIVDFIQRYALPLLNSWQSIAGVKAFVGTEQSRGFTVSDRLSNQPCI